jgi:hypothetical protein
MRQRQPRQKNDGHLQYIRTLPCAICGDDTTVEAAHIRMKDPSIGKPMTGIGTKPHDKFTLPLCGLHHRDQHLNGEHEWWETVGIDPVKLALALYSVSGDYGEGLTVLGRA